jgi:isopentenyl-diphosphate delta-isomerase
MPEQVTLVNQHDQAIGASEKIKAHVDGALHRAFSIFVFNPLGKVLLQKRAGSKYHSAGLWSNTCCGHPRPDEGLSKAAHRRLQEEMGFDCVLNKAFSFIYKAELENDLVEHEFDHVFIGSFHGNPVLNPEEADEYQWVSIADLKAGLAKEAGRYTYWLKPSFDSLLAHLEQNPSAKPRPG